MILEGKIREFTADLERQGLLRTRQIRNTVTTQRVSFDSNDYLSLASDERIGQAYQRGYALYPSGSGASMLLSGYHENHRAVEQAFSQFLAVDDCLLFSSGYAANLAVTALLGRIQSECLIDKGIHASIYDGLSSSQVKYTRYIHNNINELNKKLTENITSVITEGIFSMSGQIAPLSDISPLCQKQGSALIVDEAHSFGVLGDQGRGSVAHHGLTQAEVPLRIIPLGKVFAAQGAIVAGRRSWINGLLQAGRSLIYSTAISPALSYGLLKTLEVVAESDHRRVRLIELIDLFKGQIKKSPLQWAQSHTAIQQLQLGCPHLAQYYAQQLEAEGFGCSPIRSPTVAPKNTGLRIILNSGHQPEQIHQLFNKLDKIYEQSTSYATR
ncbi:aminotransferase class I/II-fold pyridoxal phosphate-dependent enzyme [Legionella shakespearei]|uniref:8-amino-7-oxononanoate synthase n=1 Tax=Legionella shakespearei DSM 23087 TaxID=1122169 RepID=A0A0W0YVQ9_9GAMM|nr:aminotransferase class I/II-fold pyridoxal phosphate-dependent enzyme [Legionella shakespearei]KTD60953.1 8-amino-7-oxononanoate synthase [Legionella shakespearei DSM 23087]